MICPRRNTAKFIIPLLVLCMLVVVSSSSLAVTRTWTTFGGGLFNDANNWFPSGIPNVNDFVSFEVGSGFPYTVTFPGGQLGDPVANFTTSHLRVRDNGVTFSGSTQAGRGPSTYTVASTTMTEANRGIIIGVFGGENAALNVSHSGIVCCGGLSSFSGVAATLGDAASAAGTLNMNTGTFNVTGSDANQTQLIIGNSGNGTLNVNNGADVNVSGTNSRTSLGHHATGVGAVSINGAGSTWTSANEFWIGESGTGTLTVQNGGSLITNGLGGTAASILGTFSGGSGTAMVTGAGSTWTNGAELRVGNSGSGLLTISNGGSLIHTNGLKSITIESSGGSLATVTGAGSSLTTPGTIYVGSTGTGALSVRNGGSVTSGGVQLRGLNSGSGIVLVTGAGSTFNVTNALTIGLPEPGFTTGPAELIIELGGTVTVGGDINVDISGLVQLHGGTLDANAIRFLSGGGDFDWDSGTLHARSFSHNLVNQGGILAPGHSAGRTTITGSYTQQQGAALQIEIGGNTPGTDYDVVELVPTINLAIANLGGDLQLDLIGSFVPSAANTFTVLTAGDGITGAFSNVANGQRLTTIDGLGSFLVHYGAGSAFDAKLVVLSAFVAALAGDYNNNNVVDAADYTIWRDRLGSPTSLPNDDTPGVGSDDYDRWKENFGQIAGAGSIAFDNAAVPEPSTLVLLMLAVSGWRFRRGRAAKQVSKTHQPVTHINNPPI